MNEFSSTRSRKITSTLIFLSLSLMLFTLNGSYAKKRTLITPEHEHVKFKRSMQQSTSLCSKFTVEYDPAYYCWMVDPCVENLVEAPRFLASAPCSSSDVGCEPLPPEYEECKEWKEVISMQSCSGYGPFLSCCKYKTCEADQVCLDLAPSAAFCRKLKPPPVASPTSPSPSSSPEKIAWPPIRVMPPHAPPPPPPPVPLIVPIETIPSPTVNKSSEFVPVPSVEMLNPEPGPEPSVDSRAEKISPPISPSTFIQPAPSPPPIVYQPLVENPVTYVPSPVLNNHSDLQPSPEQISVSRTEQPTWTTAAIIILVSAILLYIVGRALDRNKDRDGNLHSSDDVVAMDEDFWRTLKAQSYGSYSNFYGQPLQVKRQSRSFSELPI